MAKRLRSLSVAALLVALAACGGESSDGGASAPAPEAPAAKAPAEPPAPPKPAPAEPAAPAAPTSSADVKDDGTTVTIALTGSDALQYNLKEIRVVAGRKIRLTLTHIGKGDKETMGHNFVLLSPGTESMTFGMAASLARDSGFIPPDQSDKVIANTELIGGGESTTIEFDAPPVGTYSYLCSFTGHFATMNGKFIVTEG